MYGMTVPWNLLFRFPDQIRGPNRGDLVRAWKIKSEEQILRIKCGTNFLGCGWKMRRFSQLMTKYQVMTPKRRFAPRLVYRVEDALTFRSGRKQNHRKLNRGKLFDWLAHARRVAICEHWNASLFTEFTRATPKIPWTRSFRFSSTTPWTLHHTSPWHEGSKNHMILRLACLYGGVYCSIHVCTST
jgi:hypothetical protein